MARGRQPITPDEKEISENTLVHKWNPKCVQGDIEDFKKMGWIVRRKMKGGCLHFPSSYYFADDADFFYNLDKKEAFGSSSLFTVSPDWSYCITHIKFTPFRGNKYFGPLAVFTGADDVKDTSEVLFIRKLKQVHHNIMQTIEWKKVTDGDTNFLFGVVGFDRQMQHVPPTGLVGTLTFWMHVRVTGGCEEGV